MLRNILKKIKEKQKYINAILIIVGTFYSIVLFFTAFHNIDLLSNYSLLWNDLNREEHCDMGFYDLRDLQDCNGLFQCPDYKTIYITSVNTLFISFFILIAIIMSVGFYFLRVEFYGKK